MNEFFFFYLFCLKAFLFHYFIFTLVFFFFIRSWFSILQILHLSQSKWRTYRRAFKYINKKNSNDSIFIFILLLLLSCRFVTNNKYFSTTKIQIWEFVVYVVALSIAHFVFCWFFFFVFCLHRLRIWKEYKIRPTKPMENATYARPKKKRFDECVEMQQQQKKYEILVLCVFFF